MYIDFSGLFHNSSKDILGGGTVHIPPDEKDWPEEWSTVHYKEYPRFPSIPLPAAAVRTQAEFFELIEKRSSRRDFSGTPIGKNDLSALLKYSCGITRSHPDHNPLRAQPSGGGRYPIEMYPIVLSGDKEVPAGLYHYNVQKHSLEVLWQRPFSKQAIAEMFYYEFAQQASLALIMTAVFERSQYKYGERGYRYILLEAGHIGQNVHLCAEALGLKCSSIAGTFDEKIEKLIDIDGQTESVVYSLVLGA